MGHETKPREVTCREEGAVIVMGVRGKRTVGDTNQ